MAEDTATAPQSDSGGSNKKKKGGIAAFIKKNKTLAAVLGAGGVYFLYKMRSEPSGEVSAVEGEEGLQTSAAEGTAQLAAYETGRAERVTENAQGEVQEIEEEREHEKEKRKEEKEREEEERTPPAAGGNPVPEQPEPGPVPESPSPSAGTNGINIHGKFFAGATKQHISGTGKTVGGLAYVEYTITFPGRQEHWQYFTQSQNWRQVNNSAGGGGSNSSKPGNTGKNTPAKNNPPGAGKTPPPTKPGKPIKGPSVKPAVPATPAPAQNAQGGVPQQNAQHPAAVNTGNLCVKGGIGGHTAPPGYHLFCQGGYIWRAPNN